MGTVTIKMNSIWQNLPLELVYLVCNKLPQVRGIPIDLKEDIISSSKFEEVRDAYVEYYGEITVFDYECFDYVKRRFEPGSKSIEIDASTKDLWFKMNASERNLLYTKSLNFLY